MMSRCLIIAQQEGWSAILGDHHVEITIAVYISIAGAAPHQGCPKITVAPNGLDQKTGPAIVATVPEQLRGLAVMLAALYLVDFSLQVAIGLQKIQAAVEIVVEEKQAKGQSTA